ncbi:hypothetical protein C1645_813900 [Glomus cerebriforme]|uniref:Uncharacterized protein n=1 Tax=Glomus cerebriforme TaxID=658196 RepID=A0A397TR33_9GLOM|nr:hypothetical protein C1645_813900 [Glomus cerebriforme]
MEKIEMITTHNNRDRKLIGVYEDLGNIINRRKEKEEIRNDKWEEFYEKIETDDVRDLTKINERYIQIEEIMDGGFNIDINIDELEKVKRKKIYKNWESNENLKLKKVMKDINRLKNKADWIVQNRNKEMRLNINKEEIDWNKTFEFIMLRQDETTMETTTKNMKTRSYRIKNFITPFSFYQITKMSFNRDDYRWQQQQQQFDPGPA